MMNRIRFVGWYVLALILVLSGVTASPSSDIDKPVPLFEVVTISGETVDLHCPSTSQIMPDAVQLILWYQEPDRKPFLSIKFEDGQPVVSEDILLLQRIQVNRTSSVGVISIYNTSESDSGIYRCRVDFLVSPTAHVRHNLTILEPPSEPVFSFESHIYEEDTLFVEENGSLTMTCETSGGNSDVFVSWYKNDELVDSTMEVDTYNVHANTVHLSYLSRTDDGLLLECKITMMKDTLVGWKKVRVLLYLRPLEISLKTNSSSFQVDNGYNISCTVIGSQPAPAISWWIGNEQVLERYYQVSSAAKVTTSVLFYYPTSNDNGKILTCRAVNSVISDAVIEESLKLEVFYKPMVTLALGPTFDVNNIKETDDIFLDCFIRAHPPIHRLQWTLDGKLLNHSVSAGLIMSNQSLVIRNITRTYSGSYTCSALNREGEGTSNELDLNIQYVPFCAQESPHHTPVIEGEFAQLACVVDAEPPDVSFRWTMSSFGQDARTGRTAVPGAAVVMDGRSSILKYKPVDPLSDYGLIYCSASNSIGQMRRPCVFNVTKAGVPSSPTKCVLLSPTRNVLKVHCSDDNLTPDTTYGLEVYELDSMKLIYNKTNRIPYFVVPGIGPENRVSAVVYATNRQGRSDSVTLESAVERAVGSRTDVFGSFFYSSESLALIAVCSILLLILLSVAAALLKRTCFSEREPDTANQGQNSTTAGTVLTFTSEPPAQPPPEEEGLRIYRF